MSEGEPHLLVEVRDQIGILTFNRPDKLNALSGDMRRNFIAALESFAACADVRAVIVTGQGRAFSAGLDLKEIAASGASVEESVADENVVDAIAAFSKPIIGAINGLAITGGFEIALALDFLVAAQSATFADTHVRVGIVPGWGLSQRLSRAVGLARANEISLTGCTVSAEEALTWGLVNRVVPDEALLPCSIELVREIIAHEPDAVARVKRLIADGFGRTLAEGLSMEDAVARQANAEIRPRGVPNRS